MRKSILIPILALILAAGILLAGYNGFMALRQERLKTELTAKMQTILPGSITFTPEEYTGEDANIRKVFKGETGYVLQTVTQGYAGEITMLIGVDNDGKITGLQVREMEETYGLGGRALTDWEFLSQFLNQDGNLTVGTDVDGLTGATVTSKAITRCVNSAIGFVTGADAGSEATSWGG